MSERFFPDSMPQPLADAAALPWWEAAREHRLLVQRCAACGSTRLPPAPLCSGCRSTDSEWKQVSGRGELYTYTVVHRPIAAGQALPWVIAVVALEDAGGLRMISNVVGASPEELAIGMPLELVWEDMGPELSVPRFRPIGAAAQAPNSKPS
jgi:uncharacterized OB-fold protein